MKALHWRTWGLALLLTGVACAPERDERVETSAARDSVPVQTTPHSSTPADGQLISALRQSFRTKNPKLSKVGVLDLKAWDLLGPRIVIGWAIVGDRVFRGDFNDEMFGVFVVDESLTRVERVVDMFPTSSWFDFEVRFGRFTGDSVEVLGKGATHGDSLLHRYYKWR